MGDRSQQGYSLVEVLIAVLVLALGVIGAAGMQLSAVRTNQQSGFHTIAMQLAAEMADKMRVNDSQMKLDDSDNLFLAVDYKTATGAPAAPAKLCYATECNAAELAAFEIYEWQKRIKAALPAARVRICRDAAPWDDSAMSLAWACEGGASGAGSLVIKVGWQGKNPDGSLIKDAAGKEFPPSLALTVLPYTK